MLNASGMLKTDSGSVEREIKSQPASKTNIKVDLVLDKKKFLLAIVVSKRISS